MVKNNNCYCDKCSWFVSLKHWCVAQNKDTEALANCCEEYKGR